MEQIECDDVLDHEIILHFQMICHLFLFQKDYPFLLKIQAVFLFSILCHNRG